MTMTRQQSAETQVIRRLDRAVREVLSPARTRAQHPLEVVARAVGGEPVPFAEGVRGDLAPLRPGDPWGRAWDTVWMHVTGTVPSDWSPDGPAAGCDLELVVDLGFTDAQSGFQAEGLLHTADGRVLRALEPLNHHVPLDAAPGTGVDLWVEAAANPTLSTVTGTDLIPLSHLGSWESAGDEPVYRFGGARLVLRDVEVTALVHDVAALRGLAVSARVGRRRRDTVVAALERMLDALDHTDVAGSAAAARAALAPALAAPAATTALTVTAVGHAHIDSAWLWPLRETVRKCARTFSNVVTLMESDPDLVFGCSSAQQFAWMKQHYPDLYARIRERVLEGRFVPVGGMWVESDTNMPSGESLVRQLTAGQRFFEEEFGLTCEEVWLPDSFGYTGALPQIARSAGASRFFGQKLSWNRTNRMPHHTFQWEGIDGTRVLTHFTPVETYNSDLSPAELAFTEENFEDHGTHGGALVPFGYGDGGGGPTREMMEAGRRAADLEGLPRVRFGSPADFFADAETETRDVEPAVWVGEMYLELHRGTYTSQARTKRGNRRAEALLRRAELWCTTAAVRAGHPYPAEALRRLWEETLLLQFHDILPGSSISWVHADAERMHRANAAELETIVADALAALGRGGSSAMVANGAPFARRGVPAHGVARPRPEPAAATAVHDGADVVLRHDLVEVRVAPDGTVTGLVDRGSGRNLLDPARPGNRPCLFQDLPTDWDAWDIDEHYRRSEVPVAPAEHVAVDPATGDVVVERTVGESPMRQRLRLVPGVAALDIETTVDWRERQRMLKLAFPFRVDARQHASETQFGHVVRPTHENTSWEQARFEVVAHRWLHVGDGVVGAAVVNDSTYGHDVTRVHEPGEGTVTQVRQTLLRSALYPDPESDRGEHTFRTRIVLTPGVDGAVEAAYDLDTPLVDVASAAEVEPVVSVTGDGIVLDTVKLADDGSGDVVARFHEANGRPARATVTADAEAVLVVDVRERPVRVLRDTVDGPTTLDLRGFELVTVRFTPR